MCIAPRSSVAVVVLATLIAGAAPAVAAPNHQFFVYWDQNEEEDMLIDGQVKQLVQPWDPNGQMCIFPDHSGRFVVGYNPTLPSQDGPGGACPSGAGSGACLKPLHNPPVGEAVWDRHGDSTPDSTIFVPGPYALPGSTIGGDVPPEGGAPWQTGAFNNDSSFTGCAFDRAGHLFAADIATAQGQIPVPDSGRLIEWFPPDYTSYCIIYGPDSGGVGQHHVDGTGGLSDPGMLAVYHDDVYLPETGKGRVLRFRHQHLPRSALDCDPDGVLTPRPSLEVFIQDPTLPLPAGIARDPASRGWAVSNLLGGNAAVAWFKNYGARDPSKGPLPTGPYNPYGVAVARNGDLYFVDIHLVAGPGGFGPADNDGGVFKVTFAHGTGMPSLPQAIATGLNFPTSVTICTGRDCPTPP